MKTSPNPPSPSISGFPATWAAVLVAIVPFAIAVALVLSPGSIFQALPDAGLGTALSTEEPVEPPNPPRQIASNAAGS